MFESLSLAQIVFVAIAAFAGSVAAGISGMGGGMLLAIAIAPIVGIQALIPVMTVAMLINHIARVRAFHAHVDWPSARRVMLTALPMTAVGAMFYSILPADAVALVIGCFVLIFVPARRLLGNAPWNLSAAAFAGVGGIFGFVSGTAIGAGMIIIPALLGHGLVGPALVGTDAVIGLAVLVVKAIIFSSFAILTRDLVIFGLIIGVTTIPGVFLARWIMAHTSVRVHTILIEVLLLVGGASFVWRGLTA